MWFTAYIRASSCEKRGLKVKAQRADVIRNLVSSMNEYYYQAVVHSFRFNLAEPHWWWSCNSTAEIRQHLPLLCILEATNIRIYIPILKCAPSRRPVSAIRKHCSLINDIRNSAKTDEFGHGFTPCMFPKLFEWWRFTALPSSFHLNVGRQTFI